MKYIKPEITKIDSTDIIMASKVELTNAVGSTQNAVNIGAVNGVNLLKQGK